MDKKEMVKELCAYYWKEITLLVISILFLFQLNNLNNELLTKVPQDNFFAIIAYQNYKPLLFLAITIGLAGVAVAILVYRFNQIRNADHELYEIIYNFLSILVMIVLIITLICFINNPILRAFTIVSVAVVAVAKSSSY